MKNCAVAEFGSPVRAIAIVPGTLEQPGLAALLGLVLDRRPGRLLLEVGSESAALDHEALDHPVELRAVVELGVDVREEILDRLRRGVRVELDADLARSRVQVDLRIGGLRLGAGSDADRRDDDRDETTKHR